MFYGGLRSKTLLLLFLGKYEIRSQITNTNCSDIINNKVSFKLSNLAKAEKSIDVRENDKDVREIDIHLAEVLRQIYPFDFGPAISLRASQVSTCRGFL